MATEAQSGIDTFVERAGRWTAARSTRRSFLGTLGRVGVLVAGGAGMATLLAEQAEARVCGQSGVAPKCATFTCNDTWGWCWYASGCCAGGELKKICDCCAPNTPQPVGYCPSGTRVKCIVESCGADPRLQTRPTALLRSTDATALSVQLSTLRYPGGRPIAVLGDAEDARFAAVAATVGGIADGPVLLTSRGGLDANVAEELRRLRVEFVKVVGARLSPGIDQGLSAGGIHVERVGSSGDAGEFSAEVATWSRPLTGARRAVVVLGGVGERALGSAAAMAGALRMPLLLGDTAAVREALSSPRAVRRTYVVGDDPGAADDFAGGTPITASSPVALSLAIGNVLMGLLGGARAPLTITVDGAAAVSAALAAVPGPLLLHPAGELGPAFGWVLAHRAGVEQTFVAGTEAQFGTEALYDLQAVLNEYETHLLRGSGGDGLPVIPQPVSERPIGKARP